MPAAFSVDASSSHDRGTAAARIAGWLGAAALVLALPLVLLAALLPVNEYEAMGLDALDCDSGAAILVLAGFTYLLYGLGAAAFGALARRWPAGRRRFAAAALGCLLVMAAVTPNAVRAATYREPGCADR